MPNPNFTGSVPHRRCETCKHWRRLGSTSCALGECEHPVQCVQGMMRVLTDLSVCSNWEQKEGEGDANQA